MAAKKRPNIENCNTLEDLYHSYNNIKVNILGSTYTIYFRMISEDPTLQNSNPSGYIYSESRYIVVNYEKMQNKMKEFDIDDIKAGLKSVIRHEVVHAYLAESGLNWDSLSVDYGWAVNEEMVDWISLQLEKIHKTYVELDIDEK